MKRFFEWDAAKAETNYRKHGIQFSEAARVFDDPFAITEQDRIENGEQRWQTIGAVAGCSMLLVAHTIRFDDSDTEIVRIISARKL